MNVGEFGVGVNVLVSFDLSSYTGVAMNFTRPNGTTFSAAKPQVTVPSVPVTTPKGVYPANQYANYVFADGDLDQAGDYKVRVVATATGKRLVSDIESFTVNP